MTKTTATAILLYSTNQRYRRGCTNVAVTRTVVLFLVGTAFSGKIKAKIRGVERHIYLT